jgi:hypothetical protein
MNLIKKYEYVRLLREDGGPEGRKYVDPQGNRLPSVTTILDRTKSEKDRQALDSWRRSIGEKRAKEITTEAAFRGTLMHGYLEKYLRGDNPAPGTNYFHQQSYKMAAVIIETYIKPFLDETWGLETSLYYPELYAGTTDLVGLYQGVPSIIDFKQTNRQKDDNRVVDYKLQLAAYAAAHNQIYGTTINQGVILMCSKDLEPQRWVVTGTEFEEMTQRWWQRVADYHLSD